MNYQKWFQKSQLQGLDGLEIIIYEQRKFDINLEDGNIEQFTANHSTSYLIYGLCILKNVICCIVKFFGVKK
ncbi:hypothetical protein ACGRWE_02075 [Candidatus Phytoplasma australasiaticum]